MDPVTDQEPEFGLLHFLLDGHEVVAVVRDGDGTEVYRRRWSAGVAGQRADDLRALAVRAAEAERAQ